MRTNDTSRKDDHWPDGVQPSVPIEVYSNSRTHTPSQRLFQRPITGTEATGPIDLWCKIHCGVSDLFTTSTGKQAQGELMRVAGQVFDEVGRRVRNAILELWQADAAGHFCYPSDPAAGKADPDFLRWGRAWSTGEGTRTFHSPRPTSCTDNCHSCARYLNILVIGIGLMPTLETTLFGPEYAEENANDPVLSVLSEDVRPLLVMRDNGVVDGAQSYQFDILLCGLSGERDALFRNTGRLTASMTSRFASQGLNRYV